MYFYKVEVHLEDDRGNVLWSDVIPFFADNERQALQNVVYQVINVSEHDRDVEVTAYAKVVGQL